MCGIVGVVSSAPVAGHVVNALKRLEYRGYDSAGVATLEGGKLVRRRAEGKLMRLEEALVREPLNGSIGIGHTRWATHGRPNETNAHPHATDVLAVVHNGIIENFRELRRDLERSGTVFESETDTEVVAHLVTRAINAGKSPREAVFSVLPALRGAFALVFLFNGQEDLLIGARRGSPLAVGHGRGEMFFGSDALALTPFTETITYLEEGDLVELTREGAFFFDVGGRPAERVALQVTGGTLVAEKGDYKHFMIKEIHEQPEVIGHTIAAYVDMAAGSIRPMEALPFDWRRLERVTISACGTAYYAGLVGKYWFERLAGLPTEIDVASEFRYREAPMPQEGLMLLVSQSGETADTLASLRYAKGCRQHVVSIVNVMSSTMARESDLIAPIFAGPEIGVASTKAFTCQLAVLLVLAIQAGRSRGRLNEADEMRLVGELNRLPGLLSQALRLEPQIQALARKMSKARDVIYLGRGTSYPLALEGALKLKEISYIHAEGYAAGELKHGPIALIDEKVPVVVVAPYDDVFEKTASNMQEVAARGGKIVLLTDAQGAREAEMETLATLVLPAVDPALAPILHALPLQLIAYHIATLLGKDVDQPRNLAKSVTVE
ncbi:MAG: glutamine--fructose-6-phosphate transaminase (isomerizing) [Mesorhizobium sp.]|nr:glutamine--fructose-6-phosphate transaminase (isomerizing) [Mesorhizobium sp.]